LRDFGAEIDAGRMSLNDAIRAVTEKTADQYHRDVAALGCLQPTHEPRATEHIRGMVAMIQRLLDSGNAYVAVGGEGAEVLFDTSSMADYGQLSKRKLEDQQAGARIDVKDHKKSPADFVLWKESSASEPGWEGVFKVAGETMTIRGRPGWHIECSVMSDKWLWEEARPHLSPKGLAHPHEFDIHGGGLDLIFPHHENEIAQSRCAHGTAIMAKYWMHNGFLQVEGQKMSKSLGNFITIHELLETEKFGGRKWPGEVLRLAMLMTHYREPIDFSVRRLEEAEKQLRKFKRIADRFSVEDLAGFPADYSELKFLYNDLNFNDFFAGLAAIESEASGVLYTRGPTPSIDAILDHQITVWRRYVDPLVAAGIIEYSANKDLSEEQKNLIENRLAFIREKNWAEADRIRDELLEQGIQLKDGKDPETGERITTWEVKR
ncbi:MAG: cysteine--tRNA ligase, partial [Notoacmeibacter sp.]|nr:cysteine--tRNA ligase [Notoacmeibacter sp.]